MCWLFIKAMKLTDILRWICAYTILLKLAVFYEKEVDAKVGMLSSLLEPIIMLILGLGVGILVAGVLLPIYNLASAV